MLKRVVLFLLITVLVRSQVCPTPVAVGQGCSNHWTMVVVIDADSEESYNDFASYMDTMTTDCSSFDKIYFISPSKYDRVGSYCQFEKYQKDYFANQANKIYPFNQSDPQPSLSTLLPLLNATRECLTNINIGKNYGGVISILSSMDCNSTIIDTTVQENFTISMIKQGYDIEIIGKDCLNRVFPTCQPGCFTCSVTPYPNHITKICHKGVSTVDLAILIAVGLAILVMLIVLFFYIRWRNRQKLLEKVRAKARAREIYLESKKQQEMDIWELRQSDLEVYVDRELGSGAFAVVFEGKLVGRRPVDEIIPTAQLMGNRSDKVAVKRVPPHADALTKRDFIDEVNFMKRLGFHSHVLGMIGCITTVDIPLIVLEYCENGDLLNFLAHHRKGFKSELPGALRQKDLISVAWQISDGMVYLKSLDLIHRDLAARNILLTRDLSAKISDFGLCRQPVTSDESSVYVSRGGRLPVRWMSIESLRDFQFSFQTDVWSFGVVLWEMWSLGETPWFEVSLTAMLEVLMTGERLPSLSSSPHSIYKLMSDCWQENPEDRPPIEDLRERLNEQLSFSSLYYGYLSMREETGPDS